MGTDPAAGAQAPWGSTVVLRVSKGPDLVEVPDVVGLTQGGGRASACARPASKARFVLPVGSRVVQQSPGPRRAGQARQRGPPPAQPVLTCASGPTSRSPAAWHRAVGNALAAGCESLQVFVSNARGWAPPPLDPAADERFRADLAEAGLGPLFVHAPYLVNFASASPVTRERSREVVAATLAKAAAIGAAGVVVHAGAALASGRAAGLATTREALLPLADGLDPATGPDLVLELTAGTRGALAARFEEMAELLAACDHHPRLKVCMDTCHAQAAGYDLGDPAGATKALDELFATLGDRVVLVHANDSRDPVGAGRDRHCPIGTGTIGDQGFAAILAHPGLATLPVITETTGDPAQMAADLTRLHRLRPPTGPAGATCQEGGRAAPAAEDQAPGGAPG